MRDVLELRRLGCDAIIEDAGAASLGTVEQLVAATSEAAGDAPPLGASDERAATSGGDAGPTIDRCWRFDR